MKNIYLDHSATTPVDDKVLKAMEPYFQKNFGNPSSMHLFGREAMKGVDIAREQCAKFLNCHPIEVIFTSGATESNNLAIKGLIKALQKKNNTIQTSPLPPSKGGLEEKGASQKNYLPLNLPPRGDSVTPPTSPFTPLSGARRGTKKMHIITSAIEHDAVLEPCLEQEKQGVEVTYIQVDKRGGVDIEEVRKAIKDNTVLVSIMYVNSEIGSIQPIKKIGKMIRKINEKKINDWNKLNSRKRGPRPEPIYFHTDATQAANFLNCDVEWNYIDLLSMSGHKIYGPKGVGLLYKREGVPLEPIQRGGHHEGNLRSGTLNVPGIVGLGAAVSRLDKDAGKLEVLPPKNWKEVNRKIALLRNELVKGIMKNIPDAILNTDRNVSTPAHAHFSFPGAEGESVLIALDMKGIAVSTGSACASSSLKGSQVLSAIGLPDEIAHCSIRFTLGKENTKEDIKKVFKELPPIVARFRKMNPLYKI